MRALIFLTVLGLAACGDDPAPANEAAVDKGPAQQVVPTNDTTAIDAVSGESANMAQDVNFLENELGSDGNAAAANTAGNTVR